MSNVYWDSHVNTRVLRSSGSWKEPQSFIEDETRSGKRKRRLYKSMANREFSISMRFTLEEYEIFRVWYEVECRKGFNSFYFPKIDGDDKTLYALYRFVNGGLPNYKNVTGKIIEVSMRWEELNDK